jgi:hypothetical protein
MEIVYVPPEAVPEVWAKCLPEIEKALSVGAGQHYTADWYLDKLKTGEMVMLAAINPEVVACGILSIVEHPNHRVLFAELLAGRNIESWLPDLEPMLRKYRDHVGATTIEASCRPGLVRKLTNWRRKAVLMELV